MESNRQYNLRSQRSSTFQVPVQMETPENRGFLANLLKSCANNENSVAHRESDVSELDCSGLLNVSDVSDIEKNPDLAYTQSSCVGKQQATTSCSATGNAQELINREILQQLQLIKDLSNLKQKNTKKQQHRIQK